MINNLVSDKVHEYEKKREEKMRTVVIIEIYNLSNAERFTNLKYCFANVPKNLLTQLSEK
jgi:hypothetical protein